MTIITTPGHLHIAEVEFARKHPDIFSSHFAAEIVKNLAHSADLAGFLQQFRADINVQAGTSTYSRGNVTPLEISLAGQLVLPDLITLETVAQTTARDLLQRAGYFKTCDFSPEEISFDISRITSQSPNLNGTTRENRFADSCVVYGHYLNDEVGINGSFPALAYAQDIDKALDELLLEGSIPNLRPDGKVHVTAEYTSFGAVARRVYLSVAHSEEADLKEFRIKVLEGILAKVPYLSEAEWEINSGGAFNVYFVQADSGVSKAKDDVIITGGLHQLGTDRVWGKCAYKASTALIPYAFALSRAVCELSGARFASVSACAEYGKETAQLHLQEIDPALEPYRTEINKALKRAPRDRNSILELTGLAQNASGRTLVTIGGYDSFNDPAGFHNPEKQWKQRNYALESYINFPC